MGKTAVIHAILFLTILGQNIAFAGRPLTKLKCSARELRAQDCHLASGAYDLRLLKTTVAWNDGVWHTVDPLPLVGEGVRWERAEFAILNKRPLLQMWIWDAGVGESKVQSLHWFVADAEKRKLTRLAEGVVQKRTPRGEKEEPLYDRVEPHGLKLKGAIIEWHLGNKTTTLD